MRRILLMLVALAVTAPSAAQTPAASSAAPASATEAPAASDRAADLPVSLNRIREGLEKPEESRLKNLDVRPDFSIQIEEQHRINEILSKIDFKTGPAPAGGLYGYEQQQRLFNPTDRPLQQPYAAFSGSELITIAIENLIAKYLGGKAVDAVTSAARAHAEAQAREEVDQTIADYCAARPDRNEISLCTPPLER
jgi:hypothetical protein